MIHIRLVSPPDITAGLVDRLASNAGVFDLIVLEGVARNPDGDAVQFDVINAEANGVLQDLRVRGVAERGSIVIEDVGAALSDRATAAEARAPRALSLSPVWEQAEARIRCRWAVSAQLVRLARDRRAHRRGRASSRTRRSWSSARWSWAPSMRRSSASRSASTRATALGSASVSPRSSSAS